MDHITLYLTTGWPITQSSIGICTQFLRVNIGVFCGGSWFVLHKSCPVELLIFLLFLVDLLRCGEDMEQKYLTQFN